MTLRRWVRVCSLRELEPGRGAAALVDGQQVAIFLLPSEAIGEPASRLRAIDNRDPMSGANVLARGLLGSTDDTDYVASPMYKHRFDLDSGRCLDGVSAGVRVWPVRVWGSSVEVLSVTTGAGGLPGEVPDEGGTATHCPFCALQCGMRLRPAVDLDGAGRGVDVESDASFPVNEGRMCIKGWASVGLITNPDRLRHPLVRDRAGRLTSASWDLALDEIAGRIQAIQAAHGSDAVGVFGSGALTNEKAYLLGKFARVALRSANIDYNGRYCMSSAAAAQNRAFGIDRGLPFPISDIADTATLVLWGANPADTMPPLMQWVEKMQAQGGTLVVVDPRRTATAQAADLHIQPVPGTDLAVALGLLCLAEVSGAIDGHYLGERTAGWDEVRRSVSAWDPGRVESVAGVSRSQLRRLLDALARPSSSMLLTGRGPEQQSKGVDTVNALINLMLALGRVGRPASGYGCLTGQANGQGGREHGQKADQLPGYRSITSPPDRAAVAAIWGLDPEDLPGPGLSAIQMLNSIGTPDGLRGLLVFGSDLSVASPVAGRISERLEALELLVVADALLSRTARLAHVVLPVTQWAEEDGTTTNLEGRVIRRRRALEPPVGVRTDIDVLAGLAERLGVADKFRFASTEAVFEELRRASAGGRADYSGISYRRLDTEPGVFWPCPSDTHSGTPRLFAERFEHPDGRARMAAVGYRQAGEEPDADYPVYLTTGRYREHYNSGNQTRRLERLALAKPAPLLQLHPLLAGRLGIAEGSSVVVESRRGSAVFRADLTSDIRQDTVFAPFHWDGECSANRLTSTALDPISKMPEFKVCAVRLRPA
ncbi:MAG: nitrite reductase small subunit NirD [Acidimicrobiales bacterium]|nr:nitrite reductase small subunit NirD [Acidimicrobiales bacterium]